MIFSLKKKASLRSILLILLFSATIPFFVLENIISLSSYRITRDQTLNQIRSTTNALHTIFESLLRTSVTTYLRSKVEAGRNITYDILADNRDLEDIRLKEMVAAHLLKISVGDTGYFYAIDSTGRVTFHPDINVQGSLIPNDTPVREQLAMKEGYLEYEWKNSYEPLPRKKALYMTYIPELDWYITATSYRDEFTEMIDIDSIKKAVESLEFGKSGYSYIADSSGNFIIHPRYSSDEDRAFLLSNNYNEIISELFNVEDGFSSYSWKEKGSGRIRNKIVFSKYLDDFDWIVATAMYEQELNSPFTLLFISNALITLLIASIIFAVIRKINRSIETPVSDIYKTLNDASLGNLKTRTTPAGPMEIREVGEMLNHFLLTLEEKTESLENTISEKEDLIHEIQHRINNNLQTIASIINLQQNSVTTQDCRKNLQELYKRVSVIGMVYDHMLLSARNFRKDKLNLSAFLEDYINLFIDSYDVDTTVIKINLDFDKIYLQRNISISCGLVLNELLSHSYKFMQNSGQSSELSISIKHNNLGKVVLTVHDTATSFSEQNWNASLGNMSYTFVTVLESQLNGESELSSEADGSFGFRLTFPDSVPDTIGFKA